MSKKSDQLYLEAINFLEKKANIFGLNIFDEKLNLFEAKTIIYLIWNFVVLFIVGHNCSASMQRMEDFVFSIVNFGFGIQASFQTLNVSIFFNISIAQTNEDMVCV